MKNYSTRYKFVSTFCLALICIFSFMFSFLIGKKAEGASLPQAVDGNVFYWIIKVIAILWILLVIVLTWFKNASFHKYFPLTLAGIIYQGVPALCRIGYAKNGEVGTWVYFAIVILTLIFVGSGLLYAVSNDQYKDAENAARHSSNYYKK